MHCYYLVNESCPTLCDPMDCSLPGSSLHGISQARILEWVAISFSRGLLLPEIEFISTALEGRFFFFTTELYQGNPCTYIGYFNFFLFCLKGSFLQPFTPGLLEKKRVKQRSMNSKADSISQANSFMPIYSLCKISEALLKNDAFLQ